MPLLPYVPIELPHPGASSDGNKTTNITKQHNYYKVTDIWARWYGGNSNTKSQSTLHTTHFVNTEHFGNEANLAELISDTLI